MNFTAIHLPAISTLAPEMMPTKQPAVVFYARDFLATEFSQIGKKFQNRVRVYIVTNPTEKSKVEAIDRGSVTYDLSGAAASPLSKNNHPQDRAFNNDRFLRAYAAAEIADVVAKVADVCDAILDKFAVELYFDEPVSGYPNFLFNQRFTEVGAKCLHFQTSWIPGYMFFTADTAQAAAQVLNLTEGGMAVVENHIRNRAAGAAVPLYVINYSTVRARLRDAAVTLAKGLYRRLFRSQAYYLDQDPGAHAFHVASLLSSFLGGYLTEADLHRLSGKYVLYPLHYEPESVLNYFSEFSRQDEIVEQIIDSMPMGYELILKEHPSQPGALNLPKWRRISRFKRVLKVRGGANASALLQHDVAVVSIGSTLVIEAALAGCPVGVLGKVHFASMPGIVHLQSPREWDRILTAPRASAQQIASWYGKFLDRHCFQGNIMKNRTHIAQLDELLARLVELKPATP